MTILTTAAALNDALEPHRQAGARIGFVPTMGALHRGHAALVQRCATDSTVTVVSVFVNPTQFGDSKDLEHYPRTPVEDEPLLRQSGANYLYRPATDDIYPGGTQPGRTATLDFGRLTERMEGAHRPGHFAGVAQVVDRLLTIVGPQYLYLGQKDYQQVAIVRRMIELLALPITVITVPTVRETDGLALSSRNRRLTPEQRTAAAKINQHLAVVAAGLRAGWPARQLERLCLMGMAQTPLLEPEYVEVFDGNTLQPYNDDDTTEELVVATAVRVGAVRLIDNRIAYSRANP